MTTCPECHKPELEVSDDSFDHEFGTERLWSVYCYACGYTAGGPGPVPRGEREERIYGN